MFFSNIKGSRFPREPRFFGCGGEGLEPSASGLITLQVYLNSLFYHDGQHNQIFFSSIDDRVFRSFRTDVHDSWSKFFLAAIANCSACSADNIVHVVSGLLLMVTDASSRMDRCRDDPIRIVVIHTGTHHTGAVIHPRQYH